MTVPVNVATIATPVVALPTTRSARSAWIPGVERLRGTCAAIAMAILCAVATALLPTPARAGALSPETAVYGVGRDNNIYSIDPATGLVTGTVSTASLAISGSTANAFAIDRDRAQLYFLGSDKNLYAYDRPSGWLGQVATSTDLGLDTSDIPKNATFYDNKFWFIGAGDNLLRSAAITFGTSGPQTGLPTAVTLQTPVTITGVPVTVNDTTATPGFTDPHDIVFNPLTFMGYGAERDGSFFQLDVSTLLSGSVAYTQLAADVGATSLQLAYDQNFTNLYGMSFQTGQWYTVNTTTGTATAIDGAQTDVATNPQYKMADLAGGLVPVPEPGTLALAGSGILFAGVMVCRDSRRRRRRAAAPGVTG